MAVPTRLSCISSPPPPAIRGRRPPVRAGAHETSAPERSAIDDERTGLTTRAEHSAVSACGGRAIRHERSARAARAVRLTEFREESPQRLEPALPEPSGPFGFDVLHDRSDGPNQRPPSVRQADDARAVVAR